MKPFCCECRFYKEKDNSNVCYQWKQEFMFCQQAPFAVEIGAGENPTPGWVHVDLRRLPCIEFVQNAETLPFPDKSVKIISAKNVLEHIPYRKTLSTLKEWHRVLIDRGTLSLVIPCVEDRFKLYVNGEIPIQNLFDILGGQDYPENFHYALFDEKYTKQLLKEAGFSSSSVTLYYYLDATRQNISGYEIGAKK